MICATCRAPFDDEGRCACVVDEAGSGSSESLGLGAFLGLVLLVLYVVYAAIPASVESDCLELVKQQEAPLLRSFEQQATRTSDVEFLGWEVDLVEPWCLVTYLYRDNPDPNQRKAYLWCVDTKTRTIHRLHSLAQFIDEFLLKDDAARAASLTS